jgi:hypothetical protein
MFSGKTIINRESQFFSNKIDYFNIYVLDFDYLGKDINELFLQEQLFNKTIYLKIERRKNE